MANILKIDLDRYCTQAEYARLTGTKLATVSQWVKRSIANEGNKRIGYKQVVELGLTLVERPQ